jgi:hypothetical protein
MVLLLLALQPHTREALPFGAGLFLLGMIAGVVGALSLRSGFTERDAPPAAGVAFGPARPPTTVACPSCGGPSPVRVAEPQHSSCPFCGARFPLPPEVTARLEHAARLLQHQAAGERHIARSVAMLAARQRGWLLRVFAIALVLGTIAFLAAVFGWVQRYDRSDWHAWFAFGATSVVATGVVALLGALIVPAWMRRIVGHYTALKLPGVEGLACRACGGPLPAQSAPVLRCGYCSADNVAGRDVLARLAAEAASTARGALAIDQRRRVGDDVASAALVAFPLLVFLAWFAAGAAAGSVLIAIGHDIQLDANPDSRFAVVRIEGQPRACLAAMEVFEGGQVGLYVRAGVKLSVPAAELARYSVREPISAEWLIGKSVHTGHGEEHVASLYRRLGYLASHVARTASGSEVYLPWPDGGGELACLDLDAGSGASLRLPPAS